MTRILFLLLGVGLGLALFFGLSLWERGGDGETSGFSGPTVSGVWVRPAQLLEGDSVAVTSAAYFRVDVGEPDRLLRASSDVAVAVEIHLTTREDGVARMRPASPAELAVSPGAPLILSPGGLHVMLLGVRRSLEPGDTVALVLEFDGGARIPVSAEVRSSPPDA